MSKNWTCAAMLLLLLLDTAVTNAPPFASQKEADQWIKNYLKVRKFKDFFNQLDAKFPAPTTTTTKTPKQDSTEDTLLYEKLMRMYKTNRKEFFKTVARVQSKLRALQHVIMTTLDREQQQHFQHVVFSFG